MIRSYHVALATIALVGASAAAPADSYAIAKVVEVLEECSGAGGRHVTFELDESAHRTIHAGGHAVYAKPTGTYYVLDIKLGATKIDAAGWCIPPRTYAGEATRYMVARDADDARAKLADVRTHGWPAHWDSGDSSTYP